MPYTFFFSKKKKLCLFSLPPLQGHLILVVDAAGLTAPSRAKEVNRERRSTRQKRESPAPLKTGRFWAAKLNLLLSKFVVCNKGEEPDRFFGTGSNVTFFRPKKMMSRRHHLRQEEFRTMCHRARARSLSFFVSRPLTSSTGKKKEDSCVSHKREK